MAGLCLEREEGKERLEKQARPNWDKILGENEVSLKNSLKRLIYKCMGVCMCVYLSLCGCDCQCAQGMQPAGTRPSSTM